MQQDEIVPSVTNLTVESEFCDVTVTASDEPPAWSFDGKVWAKQQATADTLVSALRVTSEQVDDTVTLRVALPEDPENKLRGVEAKLNITIPASTKLSIRNEHGDALVQGTTVSTQIKNRHGDVRFVSLDGETSIDCEHGATTGSGLFGMAKVRARHGEVEIKEADASINVDTRHSNLKIESLGGALQLDAHHGNAKIKGVLDSVEGDIRHYDLVMGLWNDDFASIAVASQHGDVILELPESATPAIVASAEFGDVSSEFEPSSGSEGTIKVDVQHGDIRISKTMSAE